MVSTRSKRLAVLGVAVAVVTALVVWLVNRDPSDPGVSPALSQAMLPAIDSYLDDHASELLPGYLSPSLGPRTFCDGAIIEIRPDGQR